MKKMTLILFGAFVFAFTALADTWTDPETGIAWTYTDSDGGVRSLFGCNGVSYIGEQVGQY